MFKLNLPCKITICRMLLVPVFCALYLIPVPDDAKFNYFKFAAAMVFILAALTDMEGQIARKRNQVTDLGKLLDTSADKLLITGGLLLLITDITANSTVFASGALMPAWMAVSICLMIIARDFVVMALRSIAASKGTVIAADKWGKWKQLIQDISIPMYMIFASGILVNTGAFNQVYEIICISVLWLGAVLSVYSGVNYVMKNRHVFAEKPKTETKE